MPGIHLENSPQKSNDERMREEDPLTVNLNLATIVQSGDKQIQATIAAPTNQINPLKRETVELVQLGEQSRFGSNKSDFQQQV